MRPAPNLTLWMALSFSVLAHALTLSGAWFELPQSNNEAATLPLSASLQYAAPATVAPVPPPVKATAPAARTRPAKVAAAPGIIRTDAPLARPADAAVMAALSDDDTSELAAAEPAAPEMTAQAQPAEPEMTAQAQPAEPARPTEPIVLAEAAPSTFKPEPAQMRSLPKRGRIAYELSYYLGGRPLLVGSAVQTWEARESSYRLESRLQPVGFARFTRFGPRVYESSGEITAGGLQPREFTAKVVVRGKSDDTAAHFDWGNHTLQFGRAADSKNAALPAGSQDLQSFMFQLSLAPPPKGRLTMPITNGTRFENYDIDVLDEQTIDTPIGRLRTLPVKRAARAGREGIEVWLAADYHYLPVRIRVTNRDGSPGGEQIATEINIGDK
ncbi:MAG: DUF3108 domain-containing protein [Betaproteobacteria bacterium]|nr:DUF3108 domain-containing protein [Betaproteobacteria bacterium]